MFIRSAFSVLFFGRLWDSSRVHMFYTDMLDRTLSGFIWITLGSPPYFGGYSFLKQGGM